MTTEISFDDNQLKYKSRVILGAPEAPKMSKFLMDKGIVKNEKSAKTFLSILAIVFFILSLVVFAVFVFDVRLTATPPEDPNLAAQREAFKEKSLQKRNKQINNPTNNVQ